MTIFSPLRRLLGRDRRGAVSVEFALVLTPFVLTLAGMLEVGVFMAQMGVLDSAAEAAARKIRTGQITALQPFVQAIADNSFGFIDTQKLSVRSKAYSSFGTVPVPFSSMFDSNGNPVNQSFVTGTGNQVVVVEVGYQYHFVTPVVGTAIDATGSGVWTFTSTKVFRNEPF